jgi:hypothetical protein
MCTHTYTPLADLAFFFVVARARAAQVRNFVALSELYYAGSHGMDIKGPSSNVRFLALLTSISSLRVRPRS